LGSCEGVSVRFRQQINENSKMLCGTMFSGNDHNELVAGLPKRNLVVITFKTSFDYDRTVKRTKFANRFFEKYCSGVIDISAKGASRLEQYFI